MTRLGDVIAAQLDAWGHAVLPLEQELFGSTDPDAIAAAVDSWCEHHLGARIDHYLFFDSSSGTLHGVQLTDTRSVVVKGHRSTVSAEYLCAVVEIQADLVAQGLPVPAPVCGPEPMGSGLATAETYRAITRPNDPHDPRVRALLATGLASFIERATSHVARLAAVRAPMARAPGALYPEPHSPRIDFPSTTSGAAWIDAFAARARARLDALPASEPVVAHTDWRVQNVSVRDGRIDAIYDWDSVAAAPESLAVAAAATTFTVDWTNTDGPRFPRRQEIAAFVTDYVTVRGRGFDQAAATRLPTEMVASLAYGARCEHALFGPASVVGDSQRGLLAELGHALLDDGLDALSGAGSTP